MGNSLTELSQSLCVNCYSRPQELAEATIPAKTAEDTRSGGFERAQVAAALEGAKAELLELVAEGMPSEELLLRSDHCLVISRELPTGLLLKHQWLAPVSPAAFIEYVANPLRRADYDSNVKSVEVIGSLSDDIQISRVLLKGQFGISPREMVLASQVTELAEGTLLCSVSVSSDKFPEQEDPVRAEVRVGGYFVESKGNQSEVTAVSVVDLKLHKALQKLAQTMAGKALPRVSERINKALGQLN